MTGGLGGIARATGDLMRDARTNWRPEVPAEAAAIARELEAFAAANPRLSVDTRINLLTQLARTVDPACPRDADLALAVLGVTS